MAYEALNKKAQLSLTNPRDAKACQNCSNLACLQRCRWHYRSIFIRLAVVAAQSREIKRNSEKIRPYTSSRSSKVIDLGVNRKPMYDFLLVTNSNFNRICYRFRDIDA